MRCGCSSANQWGLIFSRHHPPGRLCVKAKPFSLLMSRNIRKRLQGICDSVIASWIAWVIPWAILAIIPLARGRGQIVFDLVVALLAGFGVFQLVRSLGARWLRRRKRPRRLSPASKPNKTNPAHCGIVGKARRCYAHKRKCRRSSSSSACSRLSRLAY